MTLSWIFKFHPLPGPEETSLGKQSFSRAPADLTSALTSGRPARNLCYGRRASWPQRPIRWAYTLKAALDGWIAREDDEAIRRRAAQAYDKYQKCGARAALKLFVTNR